MSRLQRQTLLVICSFAVVGIAAAADPLVEAIQRREVAAQRLEADIREMVRDANKLSTSSPAKAVNRMKEVIQLLDDDTALTAERREALRAMAKGRIRDWQSASARRNERDLDAAEREQAAGRRRTEGDRSTSDQARLSRGLQDVQALRSAGRSAEANQLQSDLSRRYPDSSAAAASRILGDRSQQIADSRRQRDDIAGGFRGTMQTIEKSAVAEGDYVFPDDWRERIARRSTGLKLTEQEKKTMRALAKPVRAQFKDTPLSGVLDYLMEATGATIVVDKRTLESVGGTYDSPVTVGLKQVELRTVLKKVLADFNLTYIVKDGVIRVVTREEARDTMTVRVYDVASLVFPRDSIGKPGELIDLAAEINAIKLTNTIMAAIDTQGWAVNNNGNGGTITFNVITLSLIVKAPAEVHMMLSGGY